MHVAGLCRPLGVMVSRGSWIRGGCIGTDDLPGVPDLLRNELGGCVAGHQQIPGEMSRFWGRAWGRQATFSLIWSCLPRDNQDEWCCGLGV